MSAIEELMHVVADDLDWLPAEPVFIGGATIGLFLDDLGRSQLRPTLDIDCIVPAVLTRVAWGQLEQELRKRNWSPDPGGPVCRYTSPNGTKVDLMPEDPGVLGFAGKWYSLAVATAEKRTLTTGGSVLVPTPPLLFASKLEAWCDRGKDDPYASEDLEDLVALLDSCAELEERVTLSPLAVREEIASGLSEILGDTTFREAAIGQLPRGGKSPEQHARVLALMARLAEGTRG